MTLIVTKFFESDARLNARREGLEDLPLAVFPMAAVPLPKEIEELKLGQKVADDLAMSLTQGLPSCPEAADADQEDVPVFAGSSHGEAWENMERHFLRNCWSDGLPLVPPTRDAVDKMLEGTELPPSHVVGVVEPAGAEATVEKIAINAVMAGCLPQYMPVILAAVEAITDPLFDLQGVQCTTGPVSPLLIVSGPNLIEQLNINDSFSTLGPGWRANATIGRAIRLVMINIGGAWPGKSDMKAFGSPFKYVTLMAENEAAYKGAWEPIRVAEGFRQAEATVSVMPAVSWQPHMVSENMATADNVTETIAEQGRVKFDTSLGVWGMDDLVLLSPSAFESIRKEGRSRKDMQNALHHAIKAPGSKVFVGREYSKESTRIP
ncbi:MAG: hypothetical protein Q7T05_03690, partial [Dehalococcoidia bacterium]|nr:hypothetical protein [Dehalococcoidia bacterium]